MPELVVHGGTMRWLRAIAAHAPGPGPNIGLRGSYTAPAAGSFWAGKRVRDNGMSFKTFSILLMT